MPTGRGTLPIVRLQWQTWVIMTVVLALAVSTALLLMILQGR